MAYWRIFQRLILRPMGRERLRTSLTVAAIALGVAAVLAIELAGDAAAGSFHSSMETLIGKADFEITATGGIAPEILSRIAALPYPFKIHPRIEDYATVADIGRTVPLVGLDLLSESASPSPSSPELSKTSTADFFEGNPIWTGAGLGYKKGDHVKLSVNDASFECIVRGVLGDRSAEMIVMDLSMAAHLFRPGGKLDRILIQAPGGRPIEEWEAILRQALPAGISVAREGTRTDENRRMLAAFRWNLRVLSYIALAVGAFLIYNAISVSVVRRRTEIGILRALGASRGGVLAAFLGEAAALGILGGIAGAALGRLMAEGAVQLVSATVQSLYVSSSPAPISLTWYAALMAVATGAIVSILSALAPAWEASLVAPVEAMGRARREHEARIHRWRSLAFAAALALCAWLAARQGPVGGKPVFGYFSAALLVGTCALAIPALILGLSPAISALARRVFGVEALLAARSLKGSLRRTSVLTGALATAIAMLTAVGIMVGSFRQTVAVWMQDRLQADLYLSPAVSAGPDQHPTLSAKIFDRLSALPGVAAIDQLRTYDIDYGGLPATLASADLRISRRYGTRPFLSGANPQAIFAQLVGTDAAVVSEPFANKHGIHAGSVITLSLAEQKRSFRVLGVYYDYSNERGTVLIDRGTMLKYLPDPNPSNIAVYLKPGVSLDEGRRAVEAAIGGRGVLVAFNRAIRQEGMRVFDRTFAITYALEAVAVFVAVMGIAGALLALVIDRRREFGLLRFLGTSNSQVRRMILFEAGLLGLLANIAGLILGYFLSLLLIYVINKQSFGWTIQFHWPAVILLSALSIVYAATLIAGLYPARIAQRLIPIEAVREE